MTLYVIACQALRKNDLLPFCRFIQTEQSIRNQLQALQSAGPIRKEDLRKLRQPYEEQQKFGEDIQRKMIARVATLKAEISALAKTISK